MGTQKVTSSEQLNDLSGGWIPTSDPITFVSADSPSYLISVNYNATGTYGVGMKLQLTHQSQVKNFFVTQVTLTGTNTYLNLYGGTDYTLNITGAITSPQYSWEKSPYGFPTSPEKWTVTYSSASNYAQASPVNSQWYNVGNQSITIPIGEWRVRWQAHVLMDGNTQFLNILCTLSIANNTESDIEFTTTTGAIYPSAFTSNRVQQNTAHEKYLTLLTKTVYYMNIQSSQNAVQIGVFGGASKTTISAICGYL